MSTFSSRRLHKTFYIGVWPLFSQAPTLLIPLLQNRLTLCDSIYSDRHLKLRSWRNCVPEKYDFARSWWSRGPSEPPRKESVTPCILHFALTTKIVWLYNRTNIRTLRNADMLPWNTMSTAELTTKQLQLLGYQNVKYPDSVEMFPI